jgi:hypothetical protein
MGSELLDVRDGTIHHLRREDVRKRFARYFERAQFSAWNDLEPPIVRVSADEKHGLDDRTREDHVHGEKQLWGKQDLRRDDGVDVCIRERQGAMDDGGRHIHLCAGQICSVADCG